MLILVLAQLAQSGGERRKSSPGGQEAQGKMRIH